MTLLFPPSFNSGDPLSARFQYKRTASDGTSSPWVFGTTGYSFIRLAWDALKGFSFEDKSAYPTLTTDGRSGPLGLSYSKNLNAFPIIGGNGARTFRVNAPASEGAQGISWDNDFNRALWSWVYQQWTVSRRVRGLPSARERFRQLAAGTAASVFGSAILIPFAPVLIGSAIYRMRQEGSDTESRIWWGALDAIELCELEQRVNPVALQLACLLVAVRLQLVARSDSSTVSLISDRTVPPPYARSPVRPEDPTGEIASRRFRTWPYRNDGGDPLLGQAVSDDPARPTPATPPQQGRPMPASIPASEQVAAPFPTSAAPSPVQGMSPSDTLAINVGYLLGGTLLVGGVIHAALSGVRRDEAVNEMISSRQHPFSAPPLPARGDDGAMGDGAMGDGAMGSRGGQ